MLSEVRRMHNALVWPSILNVVVEGEMLRGVLKTERKYSVGRWRNVILSDKKFYTSSTIASNIFLYDNTVSAACPHS